MLFLTTPEYVDRSYLILDPLVFLERKRIFKNFVKFGITLAQKYRELYFSYNYCYGERLPFLKVDGKRIGTTLDHVLFQKGSLKEGLIKLLGYLSKPKRYDFNLKIGSIQNLWIGIKGHGAVYLDYDYLKNLNNYTISIFGSGATPEDAAENHKKLKNLFKDSKKVNFEEEK